MPSHNPHPLNAPGDFYVVEGGCVYCMGPEGIAPELVSMAQDSTGCECCFFARQPETPEEIERAVQAMLSSSCRNVRYRGTDPGILRRLVDAGLADVCDHADSEKQPASGSEQQSGIGSKLRSLFRKS